MKRNLALLLTALFIALTALTGCGADSGAPEVSGGEDKPSEAAEPSPTDSVSAAAPTDTEPAPSPSDTDPVSPAAPPTDTPAETPTATAAAPSNTPPSDTPPDVPSAEPSVPPAPPVSPSEAPPSPTANTPSIGDTKSALEEIVAAADEMMPEGEKVGMTFTDPVTADNCEGMLGLTAEEFSEYVVSAYTSNAAIISVAHEVALIECVDDNAAVKVKALVAKGFNSQRWICAEPERSLVVESGKYVLLVASKVIFCDAAVAGFTVSGSTGEADIFYTKPSL
jgi:hypothetical protein